MTEVHTSAVGTGIHIESKVCRLCLSDDRELVADIFDKELQDENSQKIPLQQRLYDLLQIKYESPSALPRKICKNCYGVIESFNNFREAVRSCESELHGKLKELRVAAIEMDDKRVGLNGNPGEFVPETDATIIEVDPDQEYESSDDDFSMESDSEPEDEQIHDQFANVNQPGLQSVTAPSVISGDQDAGYSGNLPLNESYGGPEFPKNTYLCQFCDMAFTTQQDCNDHEARHDINAPYCCSFCPLRLNNRMAIINHIRESHDPERPYVCAQCSKGFCRRSDLKKHTIVHTGVRPFTCPVCAKSFSRNTNLTKHLRIHTSVRPHVCQLCPRSFTTANELLRHSRTHSEVKPFQCTRCPASFSRKDKYNLHEQVHIRRDSEFLQNASKTSGGHFNEENMVVPLNPYADHEVFAAAPATDDTYRLTNSILAAQLQQQTRPVPTKSSHPKTSHSRAFNCEICVKSFTRERDLQRHQALHLDSLFNCKQCGIGFNRREKLVKHELQFHTTQYPCGICRITFTKQEEFQQHCKIHELQQNAALASQAAANASNFALPNALVAGGNGQQSIASQEVPKGASAADLSFYNQMMPTMNLGFYSETRPEDRNGI